MTKWMILLTLAMNGCIVSPDVVTAPNPDAADSGLEKVTRVEEPDPRTWTPGEKMDAGAELRTP